MKGGIVLLNNDEFSVFVHLRDFERLSKENILENNELVSEIVDAK